MNSFFSAGVRNSIPQDVLELAVIHEVPMTPLIETAPPITLPELIPPDKEMAADRMILSLRLYIVLTMAAILFNFHLDNILETASSMITSE